jgi:hypothetical protein
MFIDKLIPSRIFSLQAKKPSGWFGRVVMSRLFNKGNAALNNSIKDLLDLLLKALIFQKPCMLRHAKSTKNTLLAIE